MTASDDIVTEPSNTVSGDDGLDNASEVVSQMFLTKSFRNSRRAQISFSNECVLIFKIITSDSCKSSRFNLTEV